MSANTETWLRLIRARIPYPAKLAFSVSRLGLARSGDSQGRELPLDRIEQALNHPELEVGLDADRGWLAQPSHHLITADHPLYPPLLKQLARPPLALYVKGKPELLGLPQIALVGSRRASPSGINFTRQLSRDLALHGFCITSGMAAGIDAAAHQGALSVAADTVAVLGTGCDRVYPAKNAALAGDIARCGALVSEFPVGIRPTPGNFPRRNRIISGLSHGVIVVEAARRSGSLITARLAGEQGREVFAVPGSVFSRQSAGCHDLIRQGATLIEGATDVMKELGLDALLDSFMVEGQAAHQAKPLAPDPQKSPGVMTESTRRLWCQIDQVPVDVDMLMVRSGMSVQAVTASLTELELLGLVCNIDGFFSRINLP